MALLQLLRESPKDWREGDPVVEADLGVSFWFWCEGCDTWHRFRTKAAKGEDAPIWTFNGSLERPTFSPSLLMWCWDWDEKAPPSLREATKVRRTTCHLILADGILNYCGDCEHALAGKSVPLKPLVCELVGGA